MSPPRFICANPGCWQCRDLAPRHRERCPNCGWSWLATGSPDVIDEDRARRMLGQMQDLLRHQPPYQSPKEGT